jgi:uncharacterized protein YheU (UPF0270 family)
MTKGSSPQGSVLRLFSDGVAEMVIPHAYLQPETLKALIEDFVTRDGAVQGHSDTPLQKSVAAVLDRLGAGTVKIVYDEASESFSILPDDGFPI